MSTIEKLPSFTIAELFDAGIHFGHKTHRWNPKMGSYIFGIKNDIHIIDLQQTAGLLRLALKVIYNTVKQNGRILFVGTKIQASPLVAEYAEKCGQYYVNHRWLGGMLTNWRTISKSIKELDSLEKLLNNEAMASAYTKKEILDKTRAKNNLLKFLGGIRNMGSKPDLIVTLDANKERIAINEARKLDIPVISIVDTNTDPDCVTYPVPGNDDAIRSLKLYLQLFSEAARAGIEEGLAAAGVDMGAAEAPKTRGGSSKVTKLKQQRRVAKSEDDPLLRNKEEEFDKLLSEQS